VLELIFMIDYEEAKMNDPSLLDKSLLVARFSLTDLKAAKEEETIVTLENIANILSVRSVAVFP